MRDNLDKGDIPDPYWAVVTHPQPSDPLVWRVFGNDHMLSHLVSASNRADIHRLNTLEYKKERLCPQLASARRRRRG